MFVRKLILSLFLLMSGIGYPAMAADGPGVEKDDLTVEKLFELLPSVGVNLEKMREHAISECKAGNMDSCGRAGTFYRYGLGGETDFAEAYAAFKSACDAKRAPACLEYGRMASIGKGGDKDLDAAFAAFDFACNADVQKACTNKGVHYQFGFGVEKNLILAKQTFARSCTKQEVVGCHNLAVMMLKEGGTKNEILGRQHLINSCDMGYEPSCDLFIRLPEYSPG